MCKVNNQMWIIYTGKAFNLNSSCMKMWLFGMQIIQEGTRKGKKNDRNLGDIYKESLLI